ncbi:hypothetical protein L484_015044 [Morus notabilis]|uniref:Uncharacterized protein n=1 Tax=Morus notabilis TaxID=981085 RepID=W9S755_9ROSA|nr:hypothetical protein L484_015044 [Morus notabilis]
MHLLVHSGFFSITKAGQEQEEKAYDLTPSSGLLAEEKLPCLSPVVQAMLDPTVITLFCFLGNWLREDKAVTPFGTTWTTIQIQQSFQ